MNAVNLHGRKIIIIIMEPLLTFVSAYMLTIASFCMKVYMYVFIFFFKLYSINHSRQPQNQVYSKYFIFIYSKLVLELTDLAKLNPPCGRSDAKIMYFHPGGAAKSVRHRTHIREALLKA